MLLQSRSVERVEHLLNTVVIGKDQRIVENNRNGLRAIADHRAHGEPNQHSDLLLCACRQALKVFSIWSVSPDPSDGKSIAKFDLGRWKHVVQKGLQVSPQRRMEPISLFGVARLNGALQKQQGLHATLVFFNFAFRQVAGLPQLLDLFPKAVATGILYLSFEISDFPIQGSETGLLVVQCVEEARDTVLPTLQFFNRRRFLTLLLQGGSLNSIVALRILDRLVGGGDQGKTIRIWKNGQIRF